MNVLVVIASGVLNVARVCVRSSYSISFFLLFSPICILRYAIVMCYGAALKLPLITHVQYTQPYYPYKHEQQENMDESGIAWATIEWNRTISHECGETEEINFNHANSAGVKQYCVFHSTILELHIYSHCHTLLHACVGVKIKVNFPFSFYVCFGEFMGLLLLTPSISFGHF